MNLRYLKKMKIFLAPRTSKTPSLSWIAVNQKMMTFPQRQQMRLQKTANRMKQLRVSMMLLMTVRVSKREK